MHSFMRPSHCSNWICSLHDSFCFTKLERVYLDYRNTYLLWGIYHVWASMNNVGCMRTPIWMEWTVLHKDRIPCAPIFVNSNWLFNTLMTYDIKYKSSWARILIMAYEQELSTSTGQQCIMLFSIPIPFLIKRGTGCHDYIRCITPKKIKKLS